jgi:UDP-N-acetyl-D-glucosamine dehydrogenase
VEALNAGRSYIRHIPSDAVADPIAAGRFQASTDFSSIASCDAVVVCVPTPLNKNREPDISYILDTGRSIAPHLRAGHLVVLESTTYPGTTDEDLSKVLEQGSGLRAGTDFNLAFSPEREDPGNPQSNVASIPKVIGGLTPECLEQAKALYGMAIQSLVSVSSCRAAKPKRDLLPKPAITVPLAWRTPRRRYGLK